MTRCTEHLWISLKEKLPPIDTLVDVFRAYIGTNAKVKLVKVPDDCMRSGFVYEWQHPSGIYAFQFDVNDEWRYRE